MRFLVIVKGDKRSEAGVMPNEQELVEMGKFNDELVRAGVMLAGEGLHPTSKGFKVKFPERKVIDGPFTEAKEIVAGYWVWQVKSREEAIEWIKRAPFREGEIELRQIFELSDFDISQETRQRFEAQDAKIREQQKH